MRALSGQRPGATVEGVHRGIGVPWTLRVMARLRTSPPSSSWKHWRASRAPSQSPAVLHSKSRYGPPFDEVAMTDDGVSVVVRRRIHPERQAAFEEWLEGIIAAASSFEGHLGAQVLRPPDPVNQDYVLLFRYATADQLAAWRTSETAKTWLEKGETFTIGDVQIQTLTGLEFWFHHGGNAPTAPPPKHKMVVATVIGLYPLILFVAPVFAANLTALPRALSVLITVVCMVLLMTYAVMPLVTRSLAGWLFSATPPR